MSAAASLMVFWGSLFLAVFFTRRKASPMSPDRDFSETFKGLAMFLVLYHHSRIYQGSDFWFLFLGGEAYAGVSMFFFISGFGLARSQNAKSRGVLRFLWLRFLALAPGVAMCMVLRGLIGPLWGQPLSLETDPLTLLGVGEWFLLALYTYYLLFILSWTAGRSRLERGFFLLAACTVIALGLVHAGSGWETARLWWRFPFSFALGALLAHKMEDVMALVRKKALPVIILSGLVLGLAWSGKDLADLPMNWAADAAIIPMSLAVCSLLFRSGWTSGFLSFLGRNSLPLFLIQVPLLKYGWLLTHWRRDGLGLLATWAVILVLAAGVGKLQRLAAGVVRGAEAGDAPLVKARSTV